MTNAITKAEELLEAASKGPWHKAPGLLQPASNLCRTIRTASGAALAFVNVWRDATEVGEANTALILKAPATLRVAVTLAKALRNTDPWTAFEPGKFHSTQGVQCVYCDREFGLHEELHHTPDCPWVVALAEFEKLMGEETG